MIVLRLGILVQERPEQGAAFRQVSGHVSAGKTGMRSRAAVTEGRAAGSGKQRARVLRMQTSGHDPGEAAPRPRLEGCARIKGGKVWKRKVVRAQETRERKPCVGKDLGAPKGPRDHRWGRRRAREPAGGAGRLGSGHGPQGEPFFTPKRWEGSGGFRQWYRRRTLSCES